MSVLVISRNDLESMLNDFREQITRDIKEALRVSNTGGQTIKLLNKKEVAEILGVSLSSIDRFRTKPDFPKPFKIDGGRPVWDMADLGNYIDNKKRGE
jgi:predicted DNA-binding transcriptional regulator AlpA